jgi:hypothetical protein
MATKFIGLEPFVGRGTIPPSAATAYDRSREVSRVAAVAGRSPGMVEQFPTQRGEAFRAARGGKPGAKPMTRSQNPVEVLRTVPRSRTPCPVAPLHVRLSEGRLPA